MPSIRSHNHTLQAENGVRLVPLDDSHLPLLYRWNTDMEVLYWVEAEDITEPYTREQVRGIYEHVSANAFCFLIEQDGVPVGDCWLQKMNLPEVLAAYPRRTDLRRIDYCIGEKTYWGKGIGTAMLKALLKFAFLEQKCDVIYIMVEDYNQRSRKLAERAGFRLESRIPAAESQKASYSLRYVQTRYEYLQKNALKSFF